VKSRLKHNIDLSKLKPQENDISEKEYEDGKTEKYSILSTL